MNRNKSKELLKNVGYAHTRGNESAINADIDCHKNRVVSVYIEIVPS